MHFMLEKQLSAATDDNKQLDLAKLLDAVTLTYEQMDGERRGIVRSMQLMSDEASALTEEIREGNANQLQAL